jgi:hypothetical protein
MTGKCPAESSETTAFFKADPEGECLKTSELCISSFSHFLKNKK